MASPPRMKIKVSDLIAEIEDHHKKATKKYEKDLAKYQEEKAVYNLALNAELVENQQKAVDFIDMQIADLRVLRRKVKAGRVNDDLRGGYFYTMDRSTRLPNVGLDLVRPVEPRKPRDPKNVLRQLRMSADEVISVTTAQFSEYLDWS